MNPETARIVEEMRARAPREVPAAVAAAELARERAYWSRRTGIPTRLMEIDWDLRLIPESVRAWAAGFPETLMECGGIFEGAPGTGKSATGAWLIRHLLTLDRGARVKMLAASDLFRWVFAQDQSRILMLRDLDLLVLDDLGVPYETHFPLGEIDALIEHRYQNRRATVVTTNLAAIRDEEEDDDVPEGEVFGERYPRVFSRLGDREGLGVVTFIREEFGEQQDLRLRGRR